MDFLVGIFYINGYGFGMAKPSGFIPVAITVGGKQAARLELRVGGLRKSYWAGLQWA